jgi:hypothetical protein
MEIYLITGLILLLLSIITPIVSLILYKKYVDDSDYIFTIVVINILTIGLLLILGFNCIIKSQLLFS